MFDNLNRPKITIPNLESPKFDDSLFDKYKEVNRLIIIGNGFDLAHGLKTSFKDYFHTI